VILVILFSFLSIIPYFLVYKAGICKPLEPREFIREKWWSVYGYIREFLTRIFPIILLIIFNIALIYIVKSSRRKMKESVNINVRKKTNASTTSGVLLDAGVTAATPGSSKRSSRLSFFKSKPTTTTTTTTSTTLAIANPENASESQMLTVKTTGGGGGGDMTKQQSFIKNDIKPKNSTCELTIAPAATSTTPAKVSLSPYANDTNEINMLIKHQANKRTRQENQLTWMTIFVGIMYSATSIPMVFAYPGLLFSTVDLGTKHYKYYAVLVNILELIQCSFRFLIYFCFTTQFRQGFFKLVGYEKKKAPASEVTQYDG
jgi:hypothetical protein